MGSAESPRAGATVPTATKDLLEAVKDGEAPESTDTNLRYAGYASKVKRLLLSAHRYVAYTSELAESMRPVAHPYLVTSGYAVSWLYLAGDVGYEGYKKYHHNQAILAGSQEPTATDKPASSSTAVSTTSTPTSPHIPAIEDYRAVMAQRAVFQSIASMGLPALMIHTIVKHSGRWLRHAKNVKIRTYGPVGLGLATVPALPYIFDEPVEHVVETVFHKGFEFFGGPGAVGHSATVEAPIQRSMQEKKEL